MAASSPRRYAAALLLLTSGCAGPSLESLYGPYFERALWRYTTHYSGFGPDFNGRLELESFPETAERTRLEIRLLLGGGPGGRQTYWLDRHTRPPRLIGLETVGGRAGLTPGLPLPGPGSGHGEGIARYAPGRGTLAARRLAFRWNYLEQPGGPVAVPAGRLVVTRADLEYRGELPLTGANLRLEFAPGLGLARAEWKTTYGTTTTFSLVSRERLAAGR